MNFLRTLAWIVLTVIVVVFSLRNWGPVTINLFGNLQADVKLPVLLLIAFLIGFLPLYSYHRTIRWRLKKKLLLAESALMAPPPVVPVEPPPFVAAPHGGVPETF